MLIENNGGTVLNVPIACHFKISLFGQQVLAEWNACIGIDCKATIKCILIGGNKHPKWKKYWIALPETTTVETMNRFNFKDVGKYFCNGVFNSDLN